MSDKPVYLNAGLSCVVSLTLFCAHARDNRTGWLSGPARWVLMLFAATPLLAALHLASWPHPELPHIIYTWTGGALLPLGWTLGLVLAFGPLVVAFCAIRSWMGAGAAGWGSVWFYPAAFFGAVAAIGAMAHGLMTIVGVASSLTGMNLGILAYQAMGRPVAILLFAELVALMALPLLVAAMQGTRAIPADPRQPRPKARK
jgi:hypothetical protein